MTNSEDKIVIDLSDLKEDEIAFTKISLKALFDKTIENYQKDLDDFKSNPIDENNLDKKDTIRVFEKYISVLKKAITESKLDEYYKEFIDTTEVREIIDDPE